MQQILLTVICVLSLVIGTMRAQDETGPQQPIVLERADSLLGSGQADAAKREFEGHVRFRQGNVTVDCDRAVHYIGANKVDLIGHVRITQGTIIIEAPAVNYDGASMIANARGGVVVHDGGRTVRSTSATYSTSSHMTRFVHDVRVKDDSLRIVADTLVYDRDAKVSTAWSNVVVAHVDGRSMVRGDTVVHDPQRNVMIATGHAEAWQFDAKDTVYIASDTLQTFRGDIERHVARGSARLVRGTVAARSDTMDYITSGGRITLHHAPVLWSDSTMLVADTILVDAPDRKLRSIMGQGRALLVSRTDTLHPDRYDQVSGRHITLDVERDTLRKLLAVGETRSIYYRVEGSEPQGLAQFSSDTTKVVFVDGSPEDIYWLGGIHGEHHPENIVAGRPETYRLPSFQWRTDRPIRAMPPDVPYLRRPGL